MTVRCRANEPHTQSGAQNTATEEQSEQCDVSADYNTKFWALDSNNATGWTFSLHRSAHTSSVPTQWLTSGLPTSVTRQRRESYRSPHLVPRLRMSGAIPPLLRMPSWRTQGQIYVYLRTQRFGDCFYLCPQVKRRGGGKRPTQLCSLYKYDVSKVAKLLFICLIK